MGMLLAWLATHKATRKSHRDMLEKKTSTPADALELSLEFRCRCRKWLHDQGGEYLSLLAEERAKEDGEADEPEVLLLS